MVNYSVLQIIFATKLVILGTNIPLITGGYSFEMHVTCVFVTVTIESLDMSSLYIWKVFLGAFPNYASLRKVMSFVRLLILKALDSFYLGIVFN